MPPPPAKVGVRHATGQNHWHPTGDGSASNITGGQFLNPQNQTSTYTPNPVLVSPGGSLSCSTNQATDQDTHWNEEDDPNQQADTVEYVWTLTGGEFHIVYPNSSTGTVSTITVSEANRTTTSITWFAPATTGPQTITCTIHDIADTGGQAGSKDDTDVARTAVVQVVRINLDKCPDTFIPAGGSSDNSVNITATVDGEGVTGSFKFTLYDTSDERGFCMNSYTSVPSSGNPDAEDWEDLQFEAQTGFTISGTSNSVAQTTATNLTSKTVTVSCYDYGAYGKIKVEFYPTMTAGSGPTLTGVETGGTRQFTNVPLDDNDNHIADEAVAWDYSSLDVGPGTTHAVNDDNDDTPTGSAEPGDGLSRYEEYRGFKYNSGYVRTSIEHKDVFIRDSDSIGIGYFTALSYHAHSSLQSGEWDANHKINFNNSTGHNHDMYAIYLHKRPNASYTTGVTIGTIEGGAECSCMIPYLESISASQSVKDSHIAHELGHALHLAPSSGGGDGHDPQKGCIMDSVLTSSAATTYCNSTVGSDTYHCQSEHYVD